MAPGRYVNSFSDSHTSCKIKSVKILLTSLQFSRAFTCALSVTQASRLTAGKSKGLAEHIFGMVKILCNAFFGGVGGVAFRL